MQGNGSASGERFFRIVISQLGQQEARADAPEARAVSGVVNGEMRPRAGKRRADEQEEEVALDAHGGPSKRARTQAPELNVSRFNASALTDPTGRTGQIKKVHVVNFMCHSNMEVNFNANVNFISGPNGSGKSAILQALQFCLGVRAQQTGRQSSNTGYLKEGSDSAVAEVTLWNGAGDGAYRPDLLGPFFTIHKSLTRLGNSTVKVLDARGKSTPFHNAQSIKEILQRLWVNAANPAIVLTQDKARGFLNGNKVQNELYKLMMESLGFLTTWMHLKQAQQHIKEQRAEVEDLKKQAQELQGQLQELEKRRELAADAAESEQVANDLQDQFSWATVRHFRRKIAECQHSVNSAEPRLKGLADKEAGIHDEIEHAAQQSREFEELREAYKRQLDDKNEERARVVKLFQTAMRDKNAAKRAERDAEKEVEEKGLEVEWAEKNLQAAQERSARSQARRELEEWEAQLGQAKQRVVELSQKRDGLATTQKKAREDAMEQKRAREAAEKRARESQERVKQLHLELQELRKASGPLGNMVKYHSRAAEVNRRVQEGCRNFRRQPVGPIGAYLTLHDQRYSATVVGALQSVLSSYVVHCRDDFYALRAIMKTVEPRGRLPQVYIMSFDIPAHNIQPHHKPPQRLQSILDVLQVVPDAPQPHTLINLLVDQASIERLVLADDENSGTQLLRDASVWRNTKSVWCVSGHGGPTQMQKIGHSESVWPWPGYQKPPEPLLTQDHGATIQARQAALEEERREEAAMSQEVQASRQREVASQRAETQMRQELDQARRCHDQAHQASQQLEINRPAVHSGGELEAAQEELEVAQLDLQRLQQSLQTARAHADEQTAEFNEAARAKQKVDSDMAAISEQLNRSAAHAGEPAQLQRQLREQLQAVAKERLEIQEAQQNAAGAQEEYETSLERALQSTSEEFSEQDALEAAPQLKEDLQREFGDVLARNGRTVAEVLDDCEMLKKLSQRLFNRVDRTTNELRGASQTELIDEVLKNIEEELAVLHDAKAKFDEKTGGLLALVAMQHKSLKKRFEKYTELRDETGHVINNEFRKKLKTGRNWRGHLRVDHENETVDIVVAAEKGAGATGGAAAPRMKELRSLSGGERSFSTVAFVLSLGKQVRTPFFAMDEFDVFMDAVNRKVSLTAILQFAWEQRAELQFILLSPLDMAVVEQSRAEVNQSLQAQARKHDVEPSVMHRDFIKTFVMQAPRKGAEAHRM